MKNKIILNGYVGGNLFFSENEFEVTEENIRNKINSFGGEDFEIILNTSGGDLEEAFKIYNLLKGLPVKKTCILNGFVASAGTYIACACDEVIAFSNSTFLIHEAFYSYIPDANSSELDELKSKLEKLNANLFSVYDEFLTRNSSDFDFREELEDKKELVLYGKEIFEAGFATKFEDLEEQRAVAFKKNLTFKRSIMEKNNNENKESILAKINAEMKQNRLDLLELEPKAPKAVMNALKNGWSKSEPAFIAEMALEISEKNLAVNLKAENIRAENPEKFEAKQEKNQEFDLDAHIKKVLGKK